MRKKIGSRVNINCTNGRLRFGTIDKKCPHVIYIEGGFYIKPKQFKSNYKDDIYSISKEIKQIVKNNITADKNFFPEFNFFTEIADDRINTNKKTYFSFQIFLKPKLTTTMNFQTFLNTIEDKEKWLEIVRKKIADNDYITTKTK